MKIPICYITFIDRKNNDPYQQNSLAVPLYNSSTREEFIADILMPCTQDHASWILSGIALFLNTY